MHTIITASGSAYPGLIKPPCYAADVPHAVPHLSPMQATALYCFSAHRGPVLSLSTGATTGGAPVLDMHGYPVLLSTSADDAMVKVRGYFCLRISSDL